MSEGVVNLPPEFDLPIRGTGELLESLRKRLKQPATTIAKELGLTGRKVRMIERNKAPVRFSILMRWSAHFGFTPQQFQQMAEAHLRKLQAQSRKDKKEEKKKRP